MRSPGTGTFARPLRRSLSTRQLSPLVLSHSSIHRSGGSLYRCHPADTLLRCAIHSCRCCAIRSHQQSDRFCLTGPPTAGHPTPHPRRIAAAVVCYLLAMQCAWEDTPCVFSRCLLMSSGPSVASHRNMSHGQRAECVVLLL